MSYIVDWKYDIITFETVSLSRHVTLLRHYSVYRARHLSSFAATLYGDECVNCDVTTRADSFQQLVTNCHRQKIIMKCVKILFQRCKTVSNEFDRFINYFLTKLHTPKIWVFFYESMIDSGDKIRNLALFSKLKFGDCQRLWNGISLITYFTFQIHNYNMGVDTSETPMCNARSYPERTQAWQVCCKRCSNSQEDFRKQNWQLLVNELSKVPTYTEPAWPGLAWPGLAWLYNKSGRIAHSYEPTIVGVRCVITSLTYGVVKMNVNNVWPRPKKKEKAFAMYYFFYSYHSSKWTYCNLKNNE